jgi:type IV secretory pathway VirB2 component (pilin)
VSSGLFYAVWAALGAAVFVLWALSYRQGSGLARPSEVVRRLATGPFARIVLVVVVMFLGWHFFAR